MGLPLASHAVKTTGTPERPQEDAGAVGVERWQRRAVDDSRRHFGGSAVYDVPGGCRAAVARVVGGLARDRARARGRRGGHVTGLRRDAGSRHRWRSETAVAGRADEDHGAGVIVGASTGAVLSTRTRICDARRRPSASVTVPRISSAPGRGVVDDHVRRALLDRHARRARERDRHVGCAPLALHVVGRRRRPRLQRDGRAAPAPRSTVTSARAWCPSSIPSFGVTTTEMTSPGAALPVRSSVGRCRAHPRRRCGATRSSRVVASPSGIGCRRHGGQHACRARWLRRRPR